MFLCFFFFFFPPPFVIGVVQWCGLLILQWGVDFAASLCSPFAFFASHWGETWLLSFLWVTAAQRHKHLMPLGRGVETDSALSYNDTANLYLRSSFFSWVVVSLKAQGALLFLITSPRHAASSRLVSPRRFCSFHTRARRHISALTLMSIVLDLSQGLNPICTRLWQALGSHCNLQNVAPCPREAGKMSLFLLHLAHWKHKKPKVYPPGRCNCRRDKRKIKLKGEATLTHGVICIDLTFQPHFYPYAHNFRPIHNRVHSLVCCALGMKRCLDSICVF